MEALLDPFREVISRGVVPPLEAFGEIATSIQTSYLQRRRFAFGGVLEALLASFRDVISRGVVPPLEAFWKRC